MVVMLEGHCEVSQLVKQPLEWDKKMAFHKVLEMVYHQ